MKIVRSSARARLHRPVLMRRYARQRGRGRALRVRYGALEVGELPVRLPGRSPLPGRSVHALRGRKHSACGLRRRGHHASCGRRGPVRRHRSVDLRSIVCRRDRLHRHPYGTGLQLGVRLRRFSRECRRAGSLRRGHERNRIWRVRLPSRNSAFLRGQHVRLAGRYAPQPVKSIGTVCADAELMIVSTKKRAQRSLRGARRSHNSRGPSCLSGSSFNLSSQDARCCPR